MDMTVFYIAHCILLNILNFPKLKKKKIELQRVVEECRDLMWYPKQLSQISKFN